VALIAPWTTLAAAKAGSDTRSAASASPVWYLAEGSSNWGFTTVINLENPNSTNVKARLTYMDCNGKGVIKTHDVTMLAYSQAAMFSSSELPGVTTDFSTKVEALDGKNIAVDRTMGWADGYAGGVHNSIGVTAPATMWYLPEGSSAWGYECWTCVQNPNQTAANVTLTYMIEGSGPVTLTRPVPALSRATYNMATDIGAKDASIQVTSDVPVIPERSMYT
jgi:hypothetical protein